ncbi:unnamed protein product [Vicia faba]|uniref:Uncharacterized protein n=1 Tax=Vicia faba TaxID=3906 RepID=A0AAV0Z7U5_VICFA|nr:unnamed protein product [Vicia faba]
MSLIHLLRSQSRNRFSSLSTNSPSVYQCFRSSTCGQPINANPIFKTQNNAKPTFKTSFQLGTSQVRWLSKVAPTEEDKISIGPASGRQSEEGDKETGIFYYGPISSTIKKQCHPKGCSGIISDILQCFNNRHPSLVRQPVHSQTPMATRFGQLRDTNRPYVTFKANGSFYFVDTEHCHNKALLARLTPQKEAHDSAFKNL